MSTKVFVDDGMGHTCGWDSTPQQTFHYVGFLGSLEGHVSNGGDIFGPQDGALLENNGVFLDKYHFVTEHPSNHEGHQVSGNMTPQN